ncbi:ParA family protein [Raineyella fluvialis]|uniref:AAA family ATPase n=1 Tax=Raineyella fluvialis TaxID=2662261 RepID=A0A5Q2FD01_9ACTN|nr:AAA family ATPase [Raineyella fluvialis]QGF23304.1 AAA family ATPase [Raineyella fluvialis]
MALLEQHTSLPQGPKRALYESDEIPEVERPDDLDDVSRETGSLPRPTSPRVIAVVNQKGGVGKTTSAVNLAAGLGFGGLNVLLVDLDPQGNASTAVGGEHRNSEPGTYEVLLDSDRIADHVQVSPEAPNLKVLVATMDLAAAEIELVSVVSRETRLKRAIDAYVAENDVDYVLIDCPPSLGILTVNAFVAARELLIPIQCEYYALEGLSQLQRSISMVQANINPDLVLRTVLLTMFDGRTRLSSDVASQVRQFFPGETMETVIPRSVRIAEAPSYGQTVLTYQPASAGGQAYLAAAEELARRGAEQD